MSCAIGNILISDHAIITLDLVPINDMIKSPKWRFNSSILQDDGFKAMLKTQIELFIKTNVASVSSVGMVWEALKAFVRGHVIQFSSHWKKQNTGKLAEESRHSLGGIESLCKRSCYSIFIAQEKTKHKETCRRVYTSTSSCQNEDILSFLTGLDLPALNTEHCKMLDAAIMAEEIKEVIRKLRAGKSPGPDELTAEFYKCFMDELTTLLLQMYNKSCERRVLPTTLSQALISLILKEGKEPTNCKNYHPISLISKDTKILANRLSTGITTLIHRLGLYVIDLPRITFDV